MVLGNRPVTPAKVGVITGTGSEDGARVGGLLDPMVEERTTPFGTVTVTEGRVAGVEVVHVSRHGARHERLSNHVDHLANLSVLLDAGSSCLVSLTVCGSVDATVTPGTLVVFDDLFFPSNRLPDGTLCTWHRRAGEEGRGHWIFDGPFSREVQAVLRATAHQLGCPVAGGCYGHVDGPRFNSRAEVAALARSGVTAVSQTAGPEVVLAGEAQLPMALVGFVTDYANGVGRPEPPSALARRIDESAHLFTALIDRALPSLAGLDRSPSGSVYRFP